MPNSPVKPHGMRIEPPPSVPTASGPMPEATAAAAPPEEPPGVFALFQGLRVMPVSGLSVTPFQPNSAWWSCRAAPRRACGSSGDAACGAGGVMAWERGRREGGARARRALMSTIL